MNQYGEVLPVGDINEKIEGYFRICERICPDGQQGVLIPQRNRRHLMLDGTVAQAVADGSFHIYTVVHESEGLALLMGHESGFSAVPGVFLPDTVLGRAQKTLQAYRRAYQLADHPRAEHRLRR